MSEEKFKEDKLQFLAAFKGERHDHIWGYELWIENNEKYCNKLLILNEGFESSWHYHQRKDETFVILEGEVSLTYAAGKGSESKTAVMKQGGKFRLKPGVIHTFKSLSPRSIIMEVSTTDDGDNVKLRAARKIIN
jgi:cupin fold WbuC family metalloprotein